MENAYSVKRATNPLGIPFSQHKRDSSEPAGKGKKWRFTSEKCTFTSKIKNHKPKSKITRKQICFLLFDALAFVPKSLKHLVSHEVSIFQSFLLEHSLSSRNSLTIKGGEEKKGKRKIYLNIPSNFPSFLKVIHSQAFQCNCRSVCADHFEDSGKS